MLFCYGAMFTGCCVMNVCRATIETVLPTAAPPQVIVPAPAPTAAVVPTRPPGASPLNADGSTATNGTSYPRRKSLVQGSLPSGVPRRPSVRNSISDKKPRLSVVIPPAQTIASAPVAPAQPTAAVVDTGKQTTVTAPQLAAVVDHAKADDVRGPSEVMKQPSQQQVADAEPSEPAKAKAPAARGASSQRLSELSKPKPPGTANTGGRRGRTQQQATQSASAVPSATSDKQAMPTSAPGQSAAPPAGGSMTATPPLHAMEPAQQGPRPERVVIVKKIVI